MRVVAPPHRRLCLRQARPLISGGALVLLTLHGQDCPTPAPASAPAAAPAPQASYPRGPITVEAGHLRAEAQAGHMRADEPGRLEMEVEDGRRTPPPDYSPMGSDYALEEEVCVHEYVCVCEGCMCM